MLTPESTVGDFLRSTISGVAERERSLLPALLTSTEVEDVHDFRVEIRKLRSILGTCASLFEPGWIANFRKELQAIDEVVSPLRNAQVLSARFAQYPVEIKEANHDLEVELNSVLGQAQVTFSHELNSELMNFLTQLDIGAIPVVDSDQPIYKFLKERNKNEWERLLKDVHKTKDQEFHRVRIQAKRVRYLGEVSAPVVGNKLSKHIEIAKQIQTLLGELQDSSMMVEIAASADVLTIEEKRVKKIEEEWKAIAKKLK